MRYVVRRGDTLFQIAQRHGVTVDEILAVNPQITDPNLIFPGQVIIIPVRRPGMPPGVRPPGMRPPGMRPPGMMPPWYIGDFEPDFPDDYDDYDDYLEEYPWLDYEVDCSCQRDFSNLPGEGAWGSEDLTGREGFGALRRGSRGPEVRLLQERLAELSYYKGNVTGDFGRQTERAVRQFQRKMGFPETGIVEEVTWAALGF